MSQNIRSHRDLQVYQRAFAASEEIYSLMDQIRRSSRSVCANLVEVWRKRRYQAAFISKLSDSESEAAETQVWIEFAVKCNYLNRDRADTVYRAYDDVLRTLVGMINHSERWIIGSESS